MVDLSLRMTLIKRGFVAHVAGLVVASCWVAIQISGLPVAGTAFEGIFLGAFLASPWAFAVLLAFLLFPVLLSKHIVMVCIVGPIIVWTTAYLTVLYGGWFPPTYMEPVIVASIVASGVFYALNRKPSRRSSEPTTSV
ncbi:hypothetical protein [Croceicoccus bisphenolivorans]|uniref:hypothetical protein n=1 Tax=Croceicoccus bisphenolivorans TaxID=1783232 RepID=UPI00082FB218|nr:hypothetical protein [Croceicoccus bisphenolivorans]